MIYDELVLTNGLEKACIDNAMVELKTIIKMYGKR